MRRYEWTLFLATSAWVLVTPAQAQDDQAAELAKKLSNPVASLISVPVQYNRDEYGGANDGATVSRVIFQPVIPFSLNEDWNLITRTLIPLVDQQDFPVCRAERIGSRRHNLQPVLFAKVADCWRLDLGSGAGPAAADCQRGRTRHRKVGHRADGGGAEADRAVDNRFSWQPYLVGGRRRRPGRCQRDLPATLFQLCHPNENNDRFDHGIHLRLGERSVVGSGDCPGGATVQDRTTDTPIRAGWKVLGRVAR